MVNARLTRAPVIIVLGPSGRSLGAQISAAIGGELCERGVTDGFSNVPDFLQAAFADQKPIIGICAAGILIRALAPVIADKRSEPAVVAVSEDGASVVPLLGGHHGANDIARQIAELTSGHAAVTTAGDVRFSVALDEPPAGYVLANPQDAKGVMAKLLAGDTAKIDGVAPWLQRADLPVDDDSDIVLQVINQRVPCSDNQLVYHPKNLALGVGCIRDCSTDELIKLVSDTLTKKNIAPQSIACVVSIDVKSNEAAVHALANHLGVEARFFDAETLNAQTPRLANPSKVVLAEVGCPGVAEGACLAAAGASSKLLVEKIKSDNATCAVAESENLITARDVGRARGRLSVVGIGPGSEEWRSGQASELLCAATDWVGYGLYLDIVKGLGDGKIWHKFDLGEEEARVRHALELAGQGRDVALVCSGDAGIYAMAALVFELMDEPSVERAVSPGAQRAEIIVVPGISAFQAAAARAGAPIGHDFCAISLSDLLTPWPVIEKRLEAAAQGDFVVAFYNPKSMRRTEQLVTAMKILSEERPPDTPVILAANLGRPKERITVTSIKDFSPDEVDMLTLVMVGSSTSRKLITGDGKPWVYTPRGYEKKRKGTL